MSVYNNISGNLEKHYQEKHPAQSIPESLLDVAAMQSENIAAKESEQSAVDRLQEAVFQASALHAIQVRKSQHVSFQTCVQLASANQYSYKGL